MSKNVFKDLGLPQPEEYQAKAVLASRIVSLIENKDWSQVKAAEMLGLTQPKISLLMHGQLTGFSIEKLMRILNKLNQDIEIVIHPRLRSKKHARILVTYAAA